MLWELLLLLLGFFFVKMIIIYAIVSFSSMWAWNNQFGGNASYIIHVTPHVLDYNDNDLLQDGVDVIIVVVRVVVVVIVGFSL